MGLLPLYFAVLSASHFTYLRASLLQWNSKLTFIPAIVILVTAAWGWLKMMPHLRAHYAESPCRSNAVLAVLAWMSVVAGTATLLWSNAPLEIADGLLKVIGIHLAYKPMLESPHWLVICCASYTCIACGRLVWIIPTAPAAVVFQQFPMHMLLTYAAGFAVRLRIFCLHSQQTPLTAETRGVLNMFSIFAN